MVVCVYEKDRKQRFNEQLNTADSLCMKSTSRNIRMTHQSHTDRDDLLSESVFVAAPSYVVYPV